MQTKLHSFIESWNNIAVGFFISWAMWLWVVSPVFGISVGATESFLITSLFTASSIIRQYLLRRFHNWLDWTSKGLEFKNWVFCCVTSTGLSANQATGLFCGLTIFLVIGFEYV
jgi:hypothetical protein